VFEHITGNGEQTTYDYTAYGVELTNDLQVAARKGTSTGSDIGQFVGHFVGLPSQLRVSLLKCGLKCQMRFDFENPNSARSKVLKPLLTFAQVCPQVAVGSVGRRPPPSNQTLKSTNHIRVVDMKLHLNIRGEGEMTYEVNRCMQLCTRNRLRRIAVDPAMDTPK
jgi:hypothetical protein